MDYIEFPGLGIEFNINNVAFTVGNIPVYWYGIIIAVGFLLAVMLALRNSKKFGISQDTILDVVLWAAPVAIIFSRLFYVIFAWDIFKDNPADILDIRKGGLAIYGAVIGGLLTAVIYCRIKKLTFLKLADFAMVYFPLAQAIGRWGNFINQEAYGTSTELPWRMDGSNILNGPVHPTFLYESLWNFGVFIILLWFRNRKKKVDGEVLWLYIILYGIGRSFVEPLRTDSLMLGSLRVSFWLAVVSAVAFTIVFIVRRVRYSDASEVETGSSNYGEILKEMSSEEDFAAEEVRAEAADIAGAAAAAANAETELFEEDGLETEAEFEAAAAEAEAQLDDADPKEDADIIEPWDEDLE